MAMIGDGGLIEIKSGEETGSGIHPYILIWAVFVVSDETSPDISFNVKRVFVDYATFFLVAPLPSGFLFTLVIAWVLLGRAYIQEPFTYYPYTIIFPLSSSIWI